MGPESVENPCIAAMHGPHSLDRCGDQTRFGPIWYVIKLVSVLSVNVQPSRLRIADQWKPDYRAVTRKTENTACHFSPLAEIRGYIELLEKSLTFEGVQLRKTKVNKELLARINK